MSICMLRHAETCYAHTLPCLFVVVGLCADQSLLRSAYTCSFEVCVGEREALCVQAEDQMVY